MTLRARFFVLLVLASLPACGGPRVLIHPSAAEAKELDYIYFVDEVSGRDSKLTRCKILPDNRVDCQVQFDLD